jgi:hypothetical protein
MAYQKVRFVPKKSINGWKILNEFGMPYSDKTYSTYYDARKVAKDMNIADKIEKISA